MALLRPIYTKHFAERYLERFNGDMNLLKKIKTEIGSKYCEHVFHCLVYGAKQRVRVLDGKVAVAMVFDDVKKQLVVTTVYR